MATLEERLAAKRAAKETPVEEVAKPSLEARLEAKRAAKAEGGLKGIPGPAVDPDSFGSSIGRAVDTLQANVGATGEVLGEQLGLPGLAEAGGEYRDKQQAEAAQYGKPSISSYKNINSWGDLGQFAEDQVAGALPGMGAVLGAGAGAAKVAPGVLKVPAAVAGSLFASLGINLGDVQNQIKEIDPEAKSTLGSVLAGGAISLLDVVGAGAIAKPLIRTLGKDVAEELLLANGVKQSVVKEAMKGAVVGGVGEGATGAAQSVIGNVSAAKATDTDLATEKVVENAINAALGGAMVGGMAGGAAGAYGAGKSNELMPDTAAEITPEGAAPTTVAGKAWDKLTNNKAFNALGSSSLKMLEPLARASTEAKDFIRNFRPDMSGAEATGKTVYEESKLKSGEWESKLSDIKEEVGGVKNFNKLVDDYENNAVPTTEAGKKYKALMDDIHTYAKTEGRLSDIGKIERFNPWSADPEVVKAKRDEFINDILPTYGNDVAKANEVVDAWLKKSENEPDQVPNIHRLVDIDPATGDMVIDPKARFDPKDPDTMKYKFSQGQIPPENSHLEKQRAFAKVPQAVLSKYAKEQTPKQRYNAVNDYIQGAAHRTAFSKRFGARGERANAMIAKAVRQAQAAGYRPKKEEVSRMFDQLDAFNGMLNPIQNKNYKAAQSAFSAFLTVKTLPLAGLSTLVETMTPAIRGDITSAIAAVGPALGEMAHGVVRRMFSGIPKTQFATMAAEAGLSLSAATNVAAQRLGGTALTRGASKLTTNFFLANGLTLLTHATRIYAAKVGDHVMQQALMQLAAGTPISSARGAKALAQLRSMGVNVKDQADAHALYNPSTPSEIATARQVRIEAMHRFASQSVLEPTAADTPMWMSDNRLHLLAMLHRYPSAFTNTILPQLVRRMGPGWNGGNLAAGAGAVGGLFLVGMMIGLGYIQDELKMVAKNGELDYVDTRTQSQRFTDVLNQTIMPVQASWITDLINAPRYGSSGFGSLSPATGFGEEAIKTIYNFADNPEEGDIYKYLYKQTPAQFFRPGREAAGQLDLID